MTDDVQVTQGILHLVSPITAQYRLRKETTVLHMGAGAQTLYVVLITRSANEPKLSSSLQIACLDIVQLAPVICPSGQQGRVWKATVLTWV